MSQLLERLLAATSVGLFMLGLEEDVASKNEGEFTDLDKAKGKFLAAYHEMVMCAELDKIQQAQEALDERKKKLLEVEP